MQPLEAMEFIVSIAKSAVLVARAGSQPYGLTMDDHIQLARAESELREWIKHHGTERTETKTDYST